MEVTAAAVVAASAVGAVASADAAGVAASVTGAAGAAAVVSAGVAVTEVRSELFEMSLGLHYNGILAPKDMRRT